MDELCADASAREVEDCLTAEVPIDQLTRDRCDLGPRRFDADSRLQDALFNETEKKRQSVRCRLRRCDVVTKNQPDQVRARRAEEGAAVEDHFSLSLAPTVTHTPLRLVISPAAGGARIGMDRRGETDGGPISCDV